MNRRHNKNRRRAFGMISHITPIAVPLFVVLFYAPFIAAPLHARGWNKSAAFAVGLALPALCVVTGYFLISLLPARFAKLANALASLVLGVPIVGVPVIIAWDCIRAL